MEWQLSGAEQALLTATTMSADDPGCVKTFYTTKTRNGLGATDLSSDF